MDWFSQLPWWIWIILSVIPYTIQHRKTPKRYVLVLIAFGWRFSLRWQKRQVSWSFSLPWAQKIQHIRRVRELMASTWVNVLFHWTRKMLPPWE